MPTLVVAGISARAMAEAAAQDGFDVVALDLFGDVDTHRAARRWLPIGAAEGLQIDPERMLAALRTLAQERAAGAPILGWVAGSGFDGLADLLQQGAALLPLLGNGADTMRRLRDPAAFFGFLDRQGIAHPPTQVEAPADAAAWLLKDAHGCGGWQVRRPPWPAAETLSAGRYYMREMPGQPMSATFLANGREVEVLGFNVQSVRPFGTRPFVFCGVLGPVALEDGLARQLTATAQALTEAFGLRGLCSLDFMRDGDALGVLEVNARPPASLWLYARPGLVQSHLRACADGALPRHRQAPAQQVRGMEIVFARRALRLDAAAARLLTGWPGAMDLPGADQAFGPGDPVCSLGVRADSAAQVRTLLNDGRERLLQSLENLA